MRGYVYYLSHSVNVYINNNFIYIAIQVHDLFINYFSTVLSLYVIEILYLGLRNGKIGFRDICWQTSSQDLSCPCVQNHLIL